MRIRAWQLQCTLTLVTTISFLCIIFGSRLLHDWRLFASIIVLLAAITSTQLNFKFLYDGIGSGGGLAVLGIRTVLNVLTLSISLAAVTLAGMRSSLAAGLCVVGAAALLIGTPMYLRMIRDRVTEIINTTSGQSPHVLWREHLLTFLPSMTDEILRKRVEALAEQCRYLTASETENRSSGIAPVEQCFETLDFAVAESRHSDVVIELDRLESLFKLREESLARQRR